jgi:hypothetical protein
MGGLGNQLFQIFAGMAYSLKHNYKMIFPYNDILTTGRPRNTYWDTFLKNFDLLTTRNPSHGLTNDQIYNFEVFRENGFEYREFPEFQPNNNVLFYGYFQSYKYFENYKHLIFSLLGLKQQQYSIKTKYAGLYGGCHTISMHFRLGDYKNLPDFHPIIPYEYYKNALNLIVNSRQNIDDIKVLYFCEEEDNLEVLKTIMRLQTEYPLVEFEKVDDKIVDWEQMLIMSCCYDNIIANSSFSWWGGYFNTNDNKIVCYPNKWFGPSNPVNTADLFPETWKRIRM